MSETQKMQLVKAKQDAILELGSLVVFTSMVYFALNPEQYNAVTEKVNTGINAVRHYLSVWQTKMSIRSLPETGRD